MQQRLQAAWAARDANLPLQTPYQALILASIVEKETGTPSDRTMIAGVFVNRLRKGMLLQTDPTVIYGLGDKFDGNLRKRDLLGRYSLQHLHPPRLDPHADRLAGPGRFAGHIASCSDRRAILRVARGWQLAILQHFGRA